MNKKGNIHHGKGSARLLNKAARPASPRHINMGQRMRLLAYPPCRLCLSMTPLDDCDLAAVSCVLTFDPFDFNFEASLDFSLFFLLFHLGFKCEP